MIGDLLHRLGSGKRERPEMKNDFWFIKHSSVFLIKFFLGGKNEYGLDKNIYCMVSDLTSMIFICFES